MNRIFGFPTRKHMHLGKGRAASEKLTLGQWWRHAGVNLEVG
jgi:hypothetical protein